MDKKRDGFFLSKKNNSDHKKPQKQDDRAKEKRDKNFDKNLNGVEEVQENNSKKPFDKKTYRLKKYSKKYKLEQWEEQRKKKLLRDYYKEIKNDVPGTFKQKSFDDVDTVDSNHDVGRFVRHPDLIEKQLSEQLQPQFKKKKDPLKQAREQLNKIKQDKLDKQQAIEKAKEERKQKIQEYKKKKQERFKKLSKKTKKGQPVMTGRLELLLEKIQKG